MIWFAAAALAALIYWPMAAQDREDPLRSAVKTASTLLLALSGWLGGAPWLIVAGLVMGSVGDFCLSRRGQNAFLAGMLAFGLAHIAYAGDFLRGTQHPLPPLLPALAMLGLAVSTEFWLIPRTGALRWPVRAYVVLLTLMALAAMALPVERWLAQTGAALFVMSDLLLALNIFVAPRRALAYALWPAYWLGQALILAGSLA